MHSTFLDGSLLGLVLLCIFHEESLQLFHRFQSPFQANRFDVVVSPLQLLPVEVDSCKPCDVDVCPALGKLSGKLARCLPSRVRGSVTRLKLVGSVMARPLESRASEVLDALLGVHCNCADAGAVPLPGTVELRYPAGSCFHQSPTWSATWSISGVGW